MKYEITYLQLCIFITVVWVIARVIIAMKTKKVSWLREAQLLLVYVSIIVIVRFVDFPLRHVNGHIDTMKFDSSKIIPPWTNFVPIIHLFDVYDGWIINIIGNIAMFIPVGIIWPVCFKKLDTVVKTTFACAGVTFLIEVHQLFFYERCSDIDDLTLNTTGAAIGALIFFTFKKMIKRRRVEESVN